MIDRRSFLSRLSITLAAQALPATNSRVRAATPDCWLEVAAPLLLEDAQTGIQSELMLTSDAFAGVKGHEAGTFATEYELCLYDATGQALGTGGVTKRMRVPAMQPVAQPVRELVGHTKAFAGGVKIRLRTLDATLPHVSDLFSSAFVRWQSAASFDNVHANPDPPQWQNTESFYYSMPFPSLAEYECMFSLFNPNSAPSAGELVLYDPLGKRMTSQGYELKPRASLFFDLNARRLTTNPLTPATVAANANQAAGQTSGLLAVTNRAGTTKGFGYLLIRQAARQRFSVEHPIHQGVFTPLPAAAPFDEQNKFKAKNMLYSPLLFKAKHLGQLTLTSRFYLGAGLPLEENQWIYPFAVDGEGAAVWSGQDDPRLAKSLSGQSERGALKLTTGQSCRLAADEIALPNNFAGGMGLAVAPDISHTMMKVEVQIHEWNTFAFTHFRPGLRAARRYQAAKPRGGIATDYIVAGARLVKTPAQVKLDELIAVMNIDDQGVSAQPILELFGSRGLVKRLALGAVPPFACRHYLLSELVAGETHHEMLSLRLVDERATLLMSVIHLDYVRRDLALDHGSDRFSTYQDYRC